MNPRILAQQIVAIAKQHPAEQNGLPSPALAFLRWAVDNITPAAPDEGPVPQGQTGTEAAYLPPVATSSSLLRETSFSFTPFGLAFMLEDQVVEWLRFTSMTWPTTGITAL